MTIDQYMTGGCNGKRFRLIDEKNKYISRKEVIYSDIRIRYIHEKKMNYIHSNKKAWEAAFDQRTGKYAQDIVSKIQINQDAFIQKPMIEYLNQIDLKDKVIGQFCCNNGRELLSIAKRGIKQGIGFDIAKNMVDFGNKAAQELAFPVTFIEANILDLDKKYHDTFDYLIITVGALCWFKDLADFFSVVHDVLKRGGKVLIHEIHPLVNALATKDEEAFLLGHEKELVHDYFKSKPWITEHMGYMSEEQKLPSTFYSFSHTLGTVITSISKLGFKIESLTEYDECIAGLVPHLDHQGVPLSYFLVASKM